MISPLESSILDANSESLGVSTSKLMDNAGRALAEEIDVVCPNRVLMVCGSGNNGGDGYTALRYSSSKIDVVAFKPPRTELCIQAAKGVKTIPLSSVVLSSYDLIVDCIIGTGPKGHLKPEYAEIIKKINSAGTRILSCDMPSGLGSNAAIEPDITVTFHDVKTGMNEKNCGKIIVKNIGIPEEAWSVVNKGDFLRYPIPDPASHKGQNGRLLIVAGGPYVGAAVSSAISALRIGCDLVTIFTPKHSFIPIASMSSAYVVKELGSDSLCLADVPDVIEFSRGVDALLIGPGLGIEEETKQAVRRIISSAGIPTVVDADGITAVSEDPGCCVNPTVFTPHSRELSRLVGANRTDTDIREFCRQHGCVILKKGPLDTIYSAERLRMNRTGCVAMTVGGTGDVLAGAIAGLMSKSLSAFDSACLGAYICGLAGEKAFTEHSYGIIADDVAQQIGHVLKEGLE